MPEEFRARLRGPGTHLFEYLQCHHRRRQQCSMLWVALQFNQAPSAQ